MTTNWMMISTAKTTMPTTKLPPTTNWPNAMITWPAAPIPSPPLSSTSRVAATFNERRINVNNSSNDGNTENSVGVLT